MSRVTTDLTVRKTVTVPLPLHEAFDLFTAGISTWWPTQTHGIHDEIERVVVDPREAEVYEVAADGRRTRWAAVRAYDRPHRLLLEWHVNTPAPPYTEVEIRFTADGDGTRVDLEHRGWERLAGRGAERAASYEGGWAAVLSRFTDAASRPISLLHE